MSELKISELSEIVGLNIDTIRYYEKIGLISEPKRGANGYRLYNDEYITILNFISLCKNNGFKLKEIDRISELIKGESNSGELTSVVKEKVKVIEDRIEELTLLKNQLTDLLKECSLDNCTLKDFV